MNKKHHISNRGELEQLIERYFDGETSIQEEQMLRAALVQCRWKSEIIDEARFTMGYFAAHGQQQQHEAPQKRRHRAIGIAASLAIVLGVGVLALLHPHEGATDMCIAYVNGQKIQDNDQVMTMVADDMAMMDHAADAMTDQLTSLGEALELDNE